MSDSPHTPFPSSNTFAASATLLLQELQRVLQSVAEDEVAAAVHQIETAPRIFFAGAGRSKLALEAAAMRLMHLGLTTHVAGEVTAPAIQRGDLLIVASASGTTASVLHAAEVARKADAAVVVITTATQSPLAALATCRIVLGAAAKSDTGARASQQYAGSLFEQAVLLLFDGIFHSLWKSSGRSAEDLLQRHANLE